MAQSRSKEDYVKVGVRIPAKFLDDGGMQTDKALGFRFPNDSRKLTWIPKSQVADWERVKESDGEYCTFAIPKWLFEQNNLEEYHDENYVDIENL